MKSVWLLYYTSLSDILKSCSLKNETNNWLMWQWWQQKNNKFDLRCCCFWIKQLSLQSQSLQLDRRYSSSLINWEFPKRNQRDLSVSHFTALFITTHDYIQSTISNQTPTKSSTPDWARHHFLFQLNCLIRQILSSRLPLKDNIDWFQLNLEIIRSLLPGFEYFH